MFVALIDTVVGRFHVPTAPSDWEDDERCLKNKGFPSYNANNSDSPNIKLTCEFNSEETIVLNCYLKGCRDDSKGGGSWYDIIVPYNIHNTGGLIGKWQSMAARVHLNYDTATVFFDSV